MGTREFPESDWKVFRELREVALQRFCKRVLEEVEPLCRDSSRRPHERYLDLFRVLQDRDEALAHAFNDPRRSGMIVQLAAIDAHGLLELDECARFTTKTREAIEVLRTELPESAR
jgi:hypothetical protein